MSKIPNEIRVMFYPDGSVRSASACKRDMMQGAIRYVRADHYDDLVETLRETLPLLDILYDIALGDPADATVTPVIKKARAVLAKVDGGAS